MPPRKLILDRGPNENSADPLQLLHSPQFHAEPLAVLLAASLAVLTLHTIADSSAAF